MTTKSGQILLDLSKYDPIPEHIILSEELNEKLSVFKFILNEQFCIPVDFLPR